jgi:hypothetical protein
VKAAPITALSVCALAFFGRTGEPRADSIQACVESHVEGQKLREQTKLAGARDRFVACAAEACPAVVRKDCAQWLDELDKMIPTIVFITKDQAGNDLSAVRVTVDGSPLADRLDGPALRVDPGEHTFEFFAPGRPRVTKKLVVREGVKERQETIVLAEATGSPAPPIAAPPPSGDEAPSSAGSTQRSLAIAAGGVGVVGIALGTVFGVDARAKWKNAQGACSGPHLADCPDHDAAVRDHDAAITSATISTAAFIAGGAALGTAIVLWLTAPKSVPTAIGIGSSVSSISVVGAF